MISNDTKTGQIIDGKAVAKLVRGQLKETVDQLVGRQRRPGLAVVLAGDDPASALYVKNKIQACKQVGIESFFHQFPNSVTQEELVSAVHKLSQDSDVDGILVQLPLPGRLSPDPVLNVLNPAKDVDGLTVHNMGLLFAGKPGLRPCTPAGIMRLLQEYKVTVSGKRAVVVGRSNLVGKPIAMLLMQENATVTVCHSKTESIDQVCRSADILVVAIGKREFIKGTWVKPGACVIDVGIHHEKAENGEAKVSGDVEFAAAAQVASLITPVPGGVGPMTVAMLLSNTVEAYRQRFCSVNT